MSAIQDSIIDWFKNGFTGGAAHDLEVVKYSTTTVKTLQGGEHQNMAVTAGSVYEINSDIDLYLKTSAVASDYGLIGLTDAAGVEVARTVGSLATMTGLEFSTGDFSLEGWVKLDGRPSAGTGSLFLAGRQNETLLPYIDIKFLKSSATDTLEWGINLGTDSASTTPIINASAALPSIPTGEVMHAVVNIDRQGSGNDVVATLFINGAQVGTLTGSSSDDAGSIDISGSTHVSSKLQLGVNWNNTPSWVGDIYNVRFYTDVLTAGQISSRNGAGPTARVNDAGLALLSWETNFQNFATWADADEVETTSDKGNTVFNAPLALVGSVGDYVLVKPGGEPALITDSPVAWAGKDKRITIPVGDSWLNIYSKPGAAGDARISLLGG